MQSSPKPPDYVYTVEERTTFDALVAKADAAIAEIKRRADSGEFTPVKSFRPKRKPLPPGRKPSRQVFRSYGLPVPPTMKSTWTAE